MIESISPFKYLLEANFCLVVFYLLYFFILKKDTFFQVNRIYLIAAPLVALILPLLNFETGTTVGSYTSSALEFIPKTIESLQQNEYFLQESLYAHPSGLSFSLGDIFWWCYIGVFFIFILKLLHSLWKINRLISTNPIQQHEGYKAVITNTGIPAFSFFNYLFWDGKERENTPLILEHERVHIRQRHSIDVVFIEIIVALLWINPIIYLIRKQLKTNHEYIADDHVLSQFGDRDKYASLLFNLFASPNPNQIATSFNSQIKNRLAMMYQKKSTHFSLLKMTAVVPMLVLLLALFSFDLADVDALVTTIENTSEIPAFTIPADVKTTKKNFDKPYVLQFGDIEFELTEQMGDGKIVIPPTYIITYKTAQKIAAEKPVLFNREQGKKYAFSVESQFSKEKIDLVTPYQSSFDLKAMLSSVDEAQAHHISLKNLKPDGEDILLNLSINIIPESSFQMTWGNLNFTIGDKLKMSGNEFVEQVALYPLKDQNALYYNTITQFREMEFNPNSGRSKSFRLHSFPFSKNAALSKIYRMVISNAKAGDRFVFKGVQVESSNIPSDYSFEIEITADADSEKLSDFSSPFGEPVIQYILNGDAVDKATFEEVDPDDILELKILDKFGRVTDRKLEDHVIIVRTKNKTPYRSPLVVYVLNGETTTKSVIDKLNPSDILEYKVYNKFGELTGVDSKEGRYIKVTTRE